MTYDAVAAADSAASIVRELSFTERRVAFLTMQGYTKDEMIAKGIARRSINESKAYIQRLRELLPDGSNYSVILRTPPAGSDEYDENDDHGDSQDPEVSWIDQQLEKLDFPPPHGADCPPCWRCMWFEGFMPAGKRDTRMVVEDAEVREAVKNTEARKIEIAQAVRDGAV